MSADLLSPAPNATAADDGTAIFLDTTTGTPVPSSGLSAWRRAAVSGGLPTPTRTRWQQLRAGVVNMWEFDAAEYWSADGRAQFVGRNEQGKSTMLAMTTLTMLTGDLSPRYVDTFGESHRTFRYYLEPTDDPKDRRATDAQLNRGWTWVEYGRLTEDGPQYFTTLLFVQARRTSQDVTKKWITHTGPQRVRDGITLVREQSVTTPGDLPTMLGITTHPNGKDYARTVAATLFGFSDTERLRTVNELLKTLRTPKLGNRLNPDWVIDRIREALPPLESSEVTELAEGWDQLGQLAADRDAAKEAEQAVTGYIQSTWHPWINATLRLAAEDLLASVTVFDDVTRKETAAKKAADDAENACSQATSELEGVEARTELTRGQRETLMASREYEHAAQTGSQVKQLTKRRRDVASLLEKAQGRQRSARGRLQTAEAKDEQARQKLAAAGEAVDSRVSVVTEQASRAGLPEDAAQWLRDHDTDRVRAAIRTRQGHVDQTRKLVGDVTRAEGVAERESRLLTEAEKREGQRQSDNQAAQAAFETAAQHLSDSLEAWAGTVLSGGSPATVAAPDADVRERWLSTVFDQCSQPRPRQVLAELVQREWVEPVSTPLNNAAARADHDADAAEALAKQSDHEADQVAKETTPVPLPPSLWQRRNRPQSTATGAPLWELLDPLATLPATELAGLETALAGAGLLDAWVTPDGVWSPERDGDDLVLTLTSRPGTGPTLATVLALADNAGAGGPLAALAPTAQRLLDSVRWGHRDPDGPTEVVRVGPDGSWSTPTSSGRAGVAAQGARLLGASARAAERARRVAALREQAQGHRERAQELRTQAAQHRRDVGLIRELAAKAPRDIEVTACALEATTAAAELERAQAERTTQARKAEQATDAVSGARTALLQYANANGVDPNALEVTVQRLTAVSTSVVALVGDLRDLRHASELGEDAASQLELARGDEQEATADAVEQDKALTRADAELLVATDALDADAQQLLARAEELAAGIKDLEAQEKRLSTEIARLSGKEGAARATLLGVLEARTAAELDRAAKLAAWWVPVDAGLAAAIGLPLTDEEGRTLTAAVRQARSVRSQRPPRRWPDAGGAAATRQKEQLVAQARDKLSGLELTKLNSTLNRIGGRYAVVEHDEQDGLPRVQVLVDASSTRFDPPQAVRALAEKSAQLGELHDEKMHKVMEELLSSTFVDHLRDKVKQTEFLLRDVNEVLHKHPTGTTRTELRLRRKQVPEHQGGYQVIQRLLEDSVDSPAVQSQVQQFLTTQIRAAQDEGHAEGADWKELLADKLDYRNWFAVVTEWRVQTSAKHGATQTWRELTRERHAQDSGGGKVMTMLQPLVATLATLYAASDTAPRPLWLDEAFDGVDSTNTDSLLGMLVDFDFDFILAGPKALVASRRVPCAAVWMVNRAQAPTPGVLLGLWLYAAGHPEKVTLGEQTWREDSDQLAPALDAAPDDSGQDGLWP